MGRGVWEVRGDHGKDLRHLRDGGRCHQGGRLRQCQEEDVEDADWDVAEGQGFETLGRLEQAVYPPGA